MPDSIENLHPSNEFRTNKQENCYALICEAKKLSIPDHLPGAQKIVDVTKHITVRPVED